MYYFNAYYGVILDKWIVTSNLIGRRVSCDESLFSDNDSVRVGCSNDNVMTTTRGVLEERMTNRIVRKKKRKDKEIIYVVWYIHYQENSIVLGTTELQCLGETRGRIPSWVWQRPTGQFFVDWAGKSTKMRGKLLCSGVGIKNSYKHRVQTADIDIIFSRMLKNWAVYNVNRGNPQAMAVISVLEHFALWWQTSVAYYDML